MTYAVSRRSRPRSAALRQARWARRGRKLLYVLPAAVLLTVLSVFPLVQLAQMSVSQVTSSNLHAAWRFIAGQNFTQDFDNPVFWQATVNTAIFVVVITVGSLVVGFAAAAVLRGGGRLTGFLMGLMVFIWALPPVVNGSVWKFLLADNGLFNVVLHAVGVAQPLPFLYNQHWALYSVAIVNTWAVIPFNALVFRAALIGIPEEVLEAARLDGAGAWQEVRHVLIPQVRGTTLVLIVLTVVYAFRSFDFIYVMTFGGPGTATNTLPFLGYLQAFVQFNFGSGAATSIIAAAMVIVLAVVYARSVAKEENE